MKDKQTPVDFLFSELERCQYFIGNDIYQAYKEAKEMEKEFYYNLTYTNDTTKGLPEEDSKRRAWHY
jgi:hypothetical protein